MWVACLSFTAPQKGFADWDIPAGSSPAVVSVILLCIVALQLVVALIDSGPDVRVCKIADCSKAVLGVNAVAYALCSEARRPQTGDPDDNAGAACMFPGPHHAAPVLKLSRLVLCVWHVQTERTLSPAHHHKMSWRSLLTLQYSR